MTIYLAGPIFSEAEQKWILEFKAHLVKEFNNEINIYFPFEIIQGLSDFEDAKVLSVCVEGLEKASVMIAILDGTQVDDGTAWEIGYFFAKEKRVILGLRTDMRKAGDTLTSDVNSLIQSSIGDLYFTSKKDLFIKLKELINF